MLIVLLSLLLLLLLLMFTVIAVNHTLSVQYQMQQLKRWLDTVTNYE